MPFINVFDPDEEIIIEEKNKKPKKFFVVIFNDDFTPMDFVVNLFQKHFHVSVEEAIAKMFEVHENGRTQFGPYSFEVAETKVYEIMSESRASEYPLLAEVHEE